MRRRAAPPLRRRPRRRPAAARRERAPTSRSPRSRVASAAGFGVAKGVARALIRAAHGRRAARSRSPGQRALSRARARAGASRSPPGFGVETRMTIDALRAGLDVEEVELDLEPPRDRPGRSRGFVHRGRQLRRRRCSRARPARRQLPGPAAAARRLPSSALVAAVASPRSPRSASPTTSGAARSAASARTSARGATTGTLKLVGIPLVGALADALAVRARCSSALSANVLNQLDTRPGRALKAYLVGSLAAPRAAAQGARRGRPPRSLRSPRDDDAGGCRIERARRHARFGVREAVHGPAERRARSERSPASPSSASAARSAR